VTYVDSDFKEIRQGRCRARGFVSYTTDPAFKSRPTHRLYRLIFYVTISPSHNKLNPTRHCRFLRLFFDVMCCG